MAISAEQKTRIADEKRWKAESDASTMKRHMEIINDPSRMREAQKLINIELKSLAQLTGNKVVSKITRRK